MVGLGGGRYTKSDPIDYGVGVVHHAKIGDKLSTGEPLLTIYANDATQLETARERLLKAIQWSDATIAPPPHTLKIIG